MGEQGIPRGARDRRKWRCRPLARALSAGESVASITGVIVFQVYDECYRLPEHQEVRRENDSGSATGPRLDPIRTGPEGRRAAPLGLPLGEWAARAPGAPIAQAGRDLRHVLR